jgi:cyanophycinase-like exopeptidase
MGSGETSPTMVKTHRALFDRLGPAPVPAVLLDTPFGFQENADDIAAKALAYFQDSVGREVGLASFRSANAPIVEREKALEAVREARYVFAGPGSPSYALRQWRGTAIPDLLRDKLRSGGCVVFSSAAALTVGSVTVPVYEVYKVGEAPHWLEGLGLLREAGLDVAVIPHFNNAEGGNHDTRYCYLGERRLALLEAELPDGAFVLGVDEHTGLIVDLGEGTVAVVGLGVVTVRAGTRTATIPAGETVAVSRLAEMAAELRGGAGAQQVQSPAAEPEPLPAGPAVSPLLESVTRLTAAFDAALAERDVERAVGAALELADELDAWSNYTSDEMDRGRAALRSMIVRLGQLAAIGAQDPAEAVGPFVEAMLDLRSSARAEERWADSDAVRDRLGGLGVEVQDTPEGVSWRLLS